MNFYHNAITLIIQTKIREWVHEGRILDTLDTQSITDTNAFEFIGEVSEDMGRIPHFEHKLFEVTPATFLVNGKGPVPGTPFDKDYLAQYWPKVTPPKGFQWYDMDQLSDFEDFDTKTHLWIACQGLHFDAECPEGVESFFDLPFFQRLLPQHFHMPPVD